MNQKKHVRFDWAIKRLLRQKANFNILEGFLSELLKDDIHILEIIDTESNQETETDKYNRVDVLVKDKKGEIIDIQPFRLSGLWAIDQSAIKAFKMVKNVPNPPEEMVDENGYIHLQFQTEVLWVPQPGVRFQGGGPGQKSN